LLAEVRVAAQAAQAAGPEDNRVSARHLSATAGSVFGSAMPDPSTVPPDGHAPPRTPSPSDGPRKRMPRDDIEWRQRIEEALRANAGNVAATARALGLHRTQLRRLLERHGIEVDAAADSDDDQATD
jgi:transcriptional regulator with GAF, ATPase, and Fis domain